MLMSYNINVRANNYMCIRFSRYVAIAVDTYRRANYFQGYKISRILKISWKNFRGYGQLAKLLPHVASTWRNYACVNDLRTRR